ncbi:ankyrin repeat domain-containing protein 9-like [Rhinoraja longicauda]
MLSAGAMPWERCSPSRDYRCQKRCKMSSFAFYQAVRDRLPVWLLEEMRTTEVLHWEESGRASAYSPSEALLYALVHDHRRYGQYLLREHRSAALASPGGSFNVCGCPGSGGPGPHLALAVRYNRVEALALLLRSAGPERARLLNGRGSSGDGGWGWGCGCGCAGARGKPPLHLAAELARAECAALLLAHGCSPRLTDGQGRTALDTVLAQLRHHHPHTPQPHLLACLHTLLLFMPRPHFHMQAELRTDDALWRRLLPHDVYQWLSGRSPPSLSMRAMQTVMAAIAPERFPEALDELPISHLLTHLDFKQAASDCKW